MTATERIPLTGNPHIESELMLTLIYGEPEWFALVADRVRGEDFIQPAASRIWAYLAEQLAAGRAVSGPELVDFFRGHGVELEYLKRIWAEFKANTMRLLPASLLEFAADEVRVASERRGLLRALREAAEVVEFQTEGDAVAAGLERLRLFTPASGKAQRFRDLEDEFRTRYEPEPVASWGVPTLDNLVPLCPGRLVYVAARTSVGKTWLGCAATMATVKDEGTVLFLSAEMTFGEIVGRLFAIESERDSPTITTNPDEWAALLRLEERIRLAESRDLLRLSSRAAQLKVAGSLNLVVVDYIQRVRPPRDLRSRQEEVQLVSERLQELAKTLEVPVFALAQFNRQADSRKEPALVDLRDSGSLEQDADAVVALWADGPKLKATVLKNRHGRLGTIDLVWRGPRIVEDAGVEAGYIDDDNWYTPGGGA